MTEWFKVSVLKIDVLKNNTVGSNPTVSDYFFMCSFFKKILCYFLILQSFFIGLHFTMLYKKLIIPFIYYKTEKIIIIEPLILFNPFDYYNIIFLCFIFFLIFHILINFKILHSFFQLKNNINKSISINYIFIFILLFIYNYYNYDNIIIIYHNSYAYENIDFTTFLFQKKIINNIYLSIILLYLCMLITTTSYRFFYFLSLFFLFFFIFNINSIYTFFIFIIFIIFKIQLIKNRNIEKIGFEPMYVQNYKQIYNLPPLTTSVTSLIKN